MAPAAAADRLLPCLLLSPTQQGGIDPIRRDYGSAFAAASHPAVLAQLERRGERLLLVGANRASELPVPDALQPFVERKSSLDFAAYYQLLSRCRAILTAFGSGEACSLGSLRCC